MSTPWIKVVQSGSPIRRRHSQRETLIGLGRRFGLLPDTAEIRGMIAKIRHLVRVLDAPLLGELTPAIKAQLTRFDGSTGGRSCGAVGFWMRPRSALDG